MNSYLRRELFTLAVIGCALLTALFLLLPPPLAPTHTIRACLQALLLWAFVWSQLWQLRFHNRSADAVSLLPTLGTANRLTLLRGGLIAVCGGYLGLAPHAAALVPAICYSLAALLDRADGYVARRHHNITMLGSELDTRVDAIGLVVAPLVAIGYGQLHVSYLLVSVAYYLFVGGLYWRRKHGKPVLPLRPSNLRRTLAGMQMGLVAFSLWPLFDPILLQLCGAAFMLPLLAGFLVDWLVVSARLPSQTSIALRNFRLLEHLSELVMQPLLRCLLVVTLWLSLAPLLAGDAANGVSGLQYSLLLISAGLVLGVGGRICALAALLLINNYSEVTAFLTVDDWWAPLLAVWVLLFGSGRFSVWQGDSSWVNRQDGA